MALANSKDKPDQTRQERARAAIEAYTIKFALNSVQQKGRHLDVDGILARSLPKTVNQWSRGNQFDGTKKV